MRPGGASVADGELRGREALVEHCAQAIDEGGHQQAAGPVAGSKQGDGEMDGRAELLTTRPWQRKSSAMTAFSTLTPRPCATRWQMVDAFSASTSILRVTLAFSNRLSTCSRLPFWRAIETNGSPPGRARGSRRARPAGGPGAAGTRRGCWRCVRLQAGSVTCPMNAAAQVAQLGVHQLFDHVRVTGACGQRDAGGASERGHGAGQNSVAERSARQIPSPPSCLMVRAASRARATRRNAARPPEEGGASSVTQLVAFAMKRRTKNVHSPIDETSRRDMVP